MTPLILLRHPSWRLPIARSVAALGLAAAVTMWHRSTVAWLAMAFLSLPPPAAVADTADLIAVYAAMAATLLLLLGARIAVTTMPQRSVVVQRST